MGNKKADTRKDKIVKKRIGKFDLYLYQSHQLPKILKEWPLYSFNLARLVVQVQQKYSDLVVLDIGANVGDTVAIIKSAIDVPIICVEGYEKYFHLLQKNVEQFDNVLTFQYYLGDCIETVPVSFQEKRGSLALSKSTNIAEISIITLDEFVRRHPEPRAARLIKIDTDGFDLSIIKGGMDFIHKMHPVLFFELDVDCLSLTIDEISNFFESLIEIGYEDIVYFDNYGRFLLSNSLQNALLMQQLLKYIQGKHGRFEYYDIAVFHHMDKDIAHQFIKSEMVEPIVEHR